jgi:predicted alpha/beta hydrolase
MIDRDHDVVPTQDHWKLTVEVLTPDAPRAVVVAGHAMMASRRSLDRPRGEGLASRLARAGVAVILPDLRGHGDSGPHAASGGTWSYDDLVRYDAPALATYARKRFPGLPLGMLGHSLFGHVSAAHAARSPQPPEFLVLLATNIWMPRLEPNPLLWAAKRATLEAIGALSARLGYFPARKLRIGSDDEAAPYFAQFLDWARADAWRSQDGEDYLATLPRFRGAALAVVGAGDVLNCRPPCARRFVESLGGPSFFWIASRARGLSLDPDHMSLVLDPRCVSLWDEIAAWILDRATLSRAA